MKWVTSKRQVKMFCAVALATICGAAMASIGYRAVPTLSRPQSVGCARG